MQSGLWGFRIIVVSLFEKCIPELNLCLLLSPHLLINLMSYLFWLNVSVVDHAVRGPLFALSLLQKSLRSSGCLVKKECSLDLVLALFVSWRSCLVWNVPAMVVNVSCVASSISRLRIFPSDEFIFKSMPYLKFLMALLQIFVEMTTHMMWVLIRQPDTWGPLGLLRTQEVSVDFRSNNLSNLLSFGSHMDVLTEESMLRVVVDLSILNASDSLAHFIETPRPELASTENVLSGTCHDRASLSCLKVSLFFLLISKKKDQKLVNRGHHKFELTLRAFRRYWRMFYKNIFVCSNQN